VRTRHGNQQDARGQHTGAEGLVHRPEGAWQEADDDGQTAQWGDHVTDDEYPA
jgi:hypothetical protein